ncbi:MAG: hypothetical protein ONB48_11915 [candidate division KSB1 bacterium]|nr:hypothetical protein [candidate division KSB1 bacterium]MDZ7273977.1 hypothetical protein [candidate division KSB1 bacterium]MDZ7286350.1 hypothetical protein [candidate division KSB1 bacterium]MDZ7296578.1 hypothetical protein [candidate division KSB1 bacterium]MDZ7306111.1 hypothetical protein [candidate division KSB1 bacterium]
MEAFNREMRWLHNQSLHQPGIGSGFAVIGKKGAREVTIMPGYVIDALGREIVLTESWVQQIPPVAGEDDGAPVFFALTVSYPADSDLEEAETREGICLPRGVVRLREQPIFCWVKLDGNGQPVDVRLKQDVLTGMKIVLARAEVLNCQLNKDLSVVQRRSARPAKQPYIACGVVDPTAWKLSDNWAGSLVQPTIIPRDLSAKIETDAAGFVTTPCYSAHILGPRKKRVTVPAGEFGTSSVVEIVIDGLVNIVDPQPKSFVVNVLLLAQSLAKDESKVDINQALFSDWHIVWMGIEG